MYLDRFFNFIVLSIKLTLFFFLSAITVFAQDVSEEIKLSNEVQQLQKVDSENINADKVKGLAKRILNNRQHYSNDILAKVFLLSANVATNQGDINKVYHFAKQGWEANSRDKKVRLSLLLKLAEVHLVRKQYKPLLTLSQTAVTLGETSNSDKHYLLSLSYRSVAFAMLGMHKQALNDLQQVEKGISNTVLAEHIELLTVLSRVYHRLADYQTSLTMQLKILKLRFETGRTMNLDQTYLYLGYAYFYLLRLDDAYNAFWESRKYSKAKNSTISVANANKGLGIVLLIQHSYPASIELFERAILVFQKNEMLTEQFESMVGLAKAKLGVKKTSEAYELLNKILKLLNGRDISLAYTGFYRMVAEMYLAKKDFKGAYRWQEKHSQVLITKLEGKKQASSVVNRLSHLSLGLEPRIEPINESRKLAVKLAENSELSSGLIEKLEKQRLVIISLSALVCILLISLIGPLLRLRAQKVRLAYEEIEKPSYVIASPIKTKFDYQLSFKKARKYKYSLAVGYLIVENWEELNFHFSRKNIREVSKEIASVINAQLTEFDCAGLLSNGEYLLLFEHQAIEEVSDKLDKLVQAINTCSFASLGAFSVTMKYSLNRPDFKDIDPYLFLARMAESVNIDRVNPPQVNPSQVSQSQANESKVPQ
ncbi:MAG: hypothetical protein GY928_28920 [Colwellia sp.]|nr:hypothetical protein [Colwellia sp.]